MPLLRKRTYWDKWFNSDESFNRLYPLYIQELARKHWTPLMVAKKAALFLAAENNVRILDIGSGVGKFCLGAAYFKPKAQYYGIEQRKNLVVNANAVKEALAFDNVFFINGNFTQLHFRDYDHFYFYNSFYENLTGTDKIDDGIDYSVELYNYYNRYLYNQLAQRPAGTRLATFHSLEDEVPQGYHIVGSEMNNLLKFWIKV
ncbi:MAG TPA: methyltransferase domain-containing protein [Chitinophagaceae bacterium]|nr:methyltransferase domain-containing protein [Chitinophagaceae bacterium]